MHEDLCGTSLKNYRLYNSDDFFYLFEIFGCVKLFYNIKFTIFRLIISFIVRDEGGGGLDWSKNKPRRWILSGLRQSQSQFCWPLFLLVQNFAAETFGMTKKKFINISRPSNLYTHTQKNLKFSKFRISKRYLKFHVWLVTRNFGLVLLLKLLTR